MGPSTENLLLVKRIVGLRQKAKLQAQERLRLNRGTGSTKTAYSDQYRDYNQQRKQNLSKVFAHADDRSHKLRQLSNSELRLPEIRPTMSMLLPSLRQEDTLQNRNGGLRAIGYN